MCILRCLLLLLAHCAEHSWSSDNVGSHTAIRRRNSRERGDDDDTGIIRQPGSAKFWYLVKQTVIYGRQAPINTTSHSNTGHMDGSPTHSVWAAAL